MVRGRGRLLPGDAADRRVVQAGVGGVVRGGERADGGAVVVWAAEFWADRVGADVGADQGGATAGVGSRGKCRTTWRREMPKAPLAFTLYTKLGNLCDFRKGDASKWGNDILSM